MEEIRHGLNGWMLVEYDWCDKRGSYFLYEREYEYENSDGEIEIKVESQVVIRQQPTWNV